MLCRQLGLPQQAHLFGPGMLSLRYEDRVYLAVDGTVHGVMGHRPGDPFPPVLPLEVPSTAVKLAR